MKGLPLLALAIICLCGQSGILALEEGDQCPFQTGQGICLGYSNCRPVLESLAARITICTYNAQEAVVCCPHDYRTRMAQLQAQDAGLRISARKCKEYIKLATPTQILSWLKPNAELIQKRGKMCNSDNKLIVGGELAKLGEFPHMAAIGYRKSLTEPIEYRCGGSMISERFVLTAAHCRSKEAVLVRLGDLDLSSDSDGAKPEDYAIEAFIKHPNYTIRTKYDDIALIKLAVAVQLSYQIRPACLYQSEEVTEQKLIATGYGAEESFGPSVNHLLKVVLDRFSRHGCQLQYRDVVGQPLTRGIVDSQICAGYADGGRDTCQGDSGGPLQVRDADNDCIFYVVAVTSFGKSCGTTIPGIYTLASWYLDWIESIVWVSNL
ncbi:venom protease-like [Topomyia yanbarensis]|uniref:venom protease-like n=1 Tax=Topomyia yanbarensis TaxID=2498891 RepID=UPI00273B5BF8|nr:venom protease-like [Topomyia yanbarensis]